MNRQKPMVQYENTVPGIFVRRINRFVAEVLIDGNAEQVHVRNTGRLKELLVPKAKVTLQKVLDPNRRSGNSENNIRKQHFDHLPGRTH